MPFVENLGNAGAILNAQYGSTPAINSNAPVLLDPVTGPFLYVPGTSANFLSVPHALSLNIAGDIDLRALCYLEDWTPTAESAVLSKWGAAGQYGYRLSVTTAGLIKLSWSADGTTILSASSTVAPTVSDGGWLWIRASLDVDNGASGRTVTFTTSTDGVTWTALGTAVTQAGTTSIFGSSAPVEIGSTGIGTADLMTGGVQVVQIAADLTGIDVRLLLDFTKELLTGAERVLLDTATSVIPASSQSLPNLGWGGGPLNAQYGSGGGADSNDPTLLPHTGENYVYMPGVGSNYVAVPDANVLDITGDLDIRIRCALDAWSPPTGTNRALVSKWNSSNLSYNFTLSDLAFRPRLFWSTNGTAGVFRQADADLPFTGGNTYWLRATLDVDNGAGGHDVAFYWADDSPTMPTSWTQLGTTITTAGTTSIFKSTSLVTIFASGNDGGSDRTPGKCYRAQIRDGIDGTIALDIDFTSITTGAAIAVPITGPVSTLATNSAYVENLGTLREAAAVRPGSGTGVDSNDPVFLPHTGENYVYTPGTLRPVTSPHSAAVAITGDLDIRMRVSMDDWTPTSQTLFTKAASPSDINWTVFATTTASNGIRFSFSQDGTTSINVNPTWSASDFVDGTTYWIRVTLDVDNGGQYQVNFYVEPDASTEPTWGAPKKTVNGTIGPVSIYAAAGQIVVGSAGSGGAPLSGKVFRAIIRNGIDGTVVWDADFTTGITSGAQTSFVESSSNAATVTITRATSGRKPVAVVRPTWLFGTDDYMEIPDQPGLNFGANESFTVFAAGRYWNTQGTNDTLIAKKANTTNTTAGWSLSNGSSTALNGQAQIGDGAAGITATSASRTVGALSTVAAVRNVATDDVTVYTDAVAGTPVTDTTTGSLSNAEAVRIGRLSGAGTEYADMEFYGAAVFRKALSSTEITTLNNYYTSGTDVAAAEALLATAVLWVDAAKSEAQAAIVRSTPGRKAVAVVRPTLLFGTDDYLEVADNDLLDFGATDSFTVMSVGRFWNTQGTNDTLVAKKADTTDTTQGWSLSNGSSTALDGQAQIGDGTAGITATSASRTAGTLTTIAAVRNTADDNVTVYTDGVAGTPVTDTTTTTLANSEVLRIGRLSGAGTEYADMELLAVAIWRRALTPTEISLVSDYYRSGANQAAAETLLTDAVLWLDPRYIQFAQINRSVTGRKTVACVDCTWLLGSDDYFEVVNDPSFNLTAVENGTWLVRVRRFHQQTAGSAFFSKAQSATASSQGWSLGNGTTGTPMAMEGRTGDSVNGTITATPVSTIGDLETMVLVRNSGTLTAWRNTIEGAPVVDSTGDLSNTFPVRIGRMTSTGTNYLDGEISAVAFWRRALSPTEIQIVLNYYGV